VSVTLVIPTIPPRADLLCRAVRSATEQTRPFDCITIVCDTEGQGAPTTRTRGLQTVTTEWTAFLDDDDELLPQHLERLLQTAEDTGADMVFPWFVVDGGTDPFPTHFGKQWDPAEPRQTTITFLVRTELAKQVGGFVDPGEGTDDLGNRAGEDFRFVCRLSDAGAKIVHLPERTWSWTHWAGNTSGQNWLQVGGKHPSEQEGSNDHR
jgi:glycosyltransferase involved in cell wall biosynthesis